MLEYVYISVTYICICSSYHLLYLNIFVVLFVNLFSIAVSLLLLYLGVIALLSICCVVFSVHCVLLSIFYVYVVCFRASCCRSLCATLVTFFITSRRMKCIYCLSTSGHMWRYNICTLWHCCVVIC